MINKEDFYIVYNVQTLEVLKTFKFFNKELSQLIDSPDLDWINRTHPKSIVSQLMLNGSPYLTVN